MHIFFAGIGGVGIGPIAEIALDAGHTIYGTDIAPGLMTESLERRGVAISYEQNGEYLAEVARKHKIDWFVHTAALREDNLEMIIARELGLRIGKRDDFLNYFIDNYHLSLIACAGTHGKTTTTGIMVWALRQLGQTPSYAIGTTLSWGSSGYYSPDSPYFVYECDEFDRNFLKFHPKVSLISSIDYDHPETYASEAEYLDAFRLFGSKSDHVITWQDQHSELFDASSDFFVEPYPLDIAGEHNRRNATLVLHQLIRMGFNRQRAVEAVESFPGTARRYERLAPNIYSDYAHHPEEIRATIQMAREKADKLVVVYQPHQNARQHAIRDLYTNSFEGADHVYWLPTYLTREDPNLPIISAAELIDNLTHHDVVESREMDNSLWARINELADQGYTVVCMGAGSIDAWLRQHIAADRQNKR